MLNKIISIKYKYLKPFNCVQIKLLVLAILGTIWLSANKWFILNRLLLLDSNTWNHLMINTEYDYLCLIGILETI